MTLFDLLERQSLDRPDNLALESDGVQFTWRQLHEHTLAWPEEPEALDSGLSIAAEPNGIPLVLRILALSRRGIQILLLNPELAEEERAGIVRNAAPVTGTSASGADAPFVHILTSGTTGFPRRIIRSQNALTALAASYNEATGTTHESRILCVLPLHHGHGLCAGLLASLESGAALFLEPGFERRRTLARLEACAITTFSALPFFFSVLAETKLREPFRCPSMRMPVAGGAPLTLEIARQVREGLGFRLRQSYGASEAGVIAFNSDPETAHESAGYPVRGVEVKADGGAIHVRGPSTSGWAASAEAEPLAGPDGWIELTDDGYLDPAGRLVVTGRRSRLMHIAGRRVHPGEIERVLCSHPAVVSARVESVAGPRGFEFPHATVSVSGPCTASELVQYSRQRLAAYKLPRSIDIRPSHDSRNEPGLEPAPVQDPKPG